MAGFETVLERIAQLGMDCEIWLNGSFITRKREPDDVDFIIFAPLTFLEGDRPERDELSNGSMTRTTSQRRFSGATLR